MKKIFIAVFLLPFSLFADRFIKQASVYKFSAASSPSVGYSTVAINLYESSPFIDDLVFSATFQKSIGFSTSSSSTLIPSFISTSGGINVSRPFNVSNDTTLVYTGWAIAPQTYKFYRLLADLYLTGYRNYDNIFVSGSNVYLNFTPSLIVSDVLAGTNSLWRSSVLSSLSSIDSSLTSLSNLLSSFVNSYQSVNFSTFDFLSFVDGMESNGVISSDQATNYRNNYNALSSDPSSQAAFVQLAKSSIENLNRVREDIQNLNNLVNDPYSRQQLNDIGSTINGSVDASINDFKRLSTNWQEGVKKDLQDWRNDVTNRLAHMFDDHVPIDGGNSTPVYVSGQNGGPVSVAGVVRIDQQMPVAVSLSAPITLDYSQFNQFSSGWESIIDAVKSFHDYFTDWASNGDIGFGWVRYYSMMFDFSQNTLTNQLFQISLLSSLTNLFANYADNFTNNVTLSISNALAGLTSVSNDYMLLSDYANYINSHGLVDLIDVMDDDTYSALKDELFGISSLDQANSYGRWWRYFTGLETINANSNYKLANLFIGHENTLNDLKDSSGADSLIDNFQQLFELIPSPSDIMDKTGNMTNSIDRSGFASLVDQSSSMSNYFNRVEMFFNRGSSLPANISINLGFGNKPGLNNAQPIVLPLDKYRGVMDLLHYGIAFSYCIVNLILLPKFLLILIHLFDRVWKGYDKKLSDAVQA